MLRLHPIPVLLLAAAPFAAAPLGAQTHHVAAPEKVTRAVAVYEWTGDLSKPTASRLVPVSLFINGHLEDAGLYLAHPVPFALEPGDIYSVEQAGDEKGTIYLEHARNFTTGRFVADQDPIGAWFGFGAFHPLAPPKPPPALHASAHTPVIVSSSDPDRPHLATKGDSTTTSPATPSADSKSGTSASAKTPMGDDPDRPTLGRKTDASSDSPSQQTPKDSSGPSDSTTPADTDTERPSLRKRNPENTGKKSPPTASVTGPDRSLNDDPDRPRIGRGKTDAQQDAAELKTTPADMRQVAAVSDNSNREPHLFTREWDTAAERADVLTHLQGLARTQVAAYLTVNHLTPGVPPPAAPVASASAAASTSIAPEASSADGNAPTLRRTPGGVNTASTPTAPVLPAQPAASMPAKLPARTAAKGRSPTRSTKLPAAPLVFTAEQLNGYTLSYGGLATFIYTAQVPVTTGGPAYVTLMVQRLPTGDFQIALHSVTDASHLDRTPWMRPIDAVDPDASHRASLLFELRARSSRQFALYRLISAQAEQEFVSSPIE